MTNEKDETVCTCGCPASDHCLDAQCCSWDETRSLGTECVLFRCSCSGYWPISKKEKQPAEVTYHERRVGPCIKEHRIRYNDMIEAAYDKMVADLNIEAAKSQQFTTLKK